MDLKKILSKKVVFVGIGNVLKSDDGVGCYIVDELSKRINKGNVFFINAGLSVENYLNKILNLSADVVIFIDAAKNFLDKDFCFLQKEQLFNNTFSTHNISLSTLIEFLESQAKQQYNKNLEIYVLAIKIKSSDFNEGLTEITKSVADRVINMICENIMNL